MAVRVRTPLISVLSRHPSCDALRGRIRVTRRAVYRHGSTTTSELGREINSIQSVKNASSKLLMKRCFDREGVRHLPWAELSSVKLEKDCVTNGKVKLAFPVVIKHTYGSRGRGNYKINNAQEFSSFVKGKTLGNYIVEQYFSGSREYRVHITPLGAVYSLRKLLKETTPKEKRWVRNDETCVWITELTFELNSKNEFVRFTGPNPKFDPPPNWKEVINQCGKALRAVGLDIGAVDLKIQSNTDPKGVKRSNPEFFIIEINSAPSLGRVTAGVYKQTLPKILEHKYGVK